MSRAGNGAAILQAQPRPPPPLAPLASPPPRRADEGGSKPLSQTAFAANWRWLIGKNAFFQPFAVNFGAIGASACAFVAGAARRARPSRRTPPPAGRAGPVQLGVAPQPPACAESP